MPANKLVVGPDGSGLSYAQFANATTGYGQVDGLRVGVNNSGAAFIGQNENSSITFLTNATTRHRIAADGTFEFGTSATDGVAEFYAAGVGAPTIELVPNASLGGSVELYEESGDRYAFLEPDYNGTGGYFAVQNGNHGAGLTVDGNGQFSGDAQVSITGLYSSTYFRTGYSGDDSVWLPDSAVSDTEILDEAGATSTSTTSSMGLDGSIQTIASESIYVPAPGVVLAIGTIEPQVADNNDIGGASFAVSDTPSSMPSGGGTYVRIPNTGSYGVWLPSLTVHGLFTVASSGTHTFYLLAKETFGAWAVYDRTLTLVYIPSNYGLLKNQTSAPTEDPDVPLVGAGTPVTDADIAAERAETEAANDARIARELAEMEARIQELRAELGNR